MQNANQDANDANLVVGNAMLKSIKNGSEISLDWVEFDYNSGKYLSKESINISNKKHIPYEEFIVSKLQIDIDKSKSFLLNENYSFEADLHIDEIQRTRRLNIANVYIERKSNDIPQEPPKRLIDKDDKVFLSYEMLLKFEAKGITISEK